MIICFKCSKETKDQLDELLKVGAYSDFSEAIALSVANQLLLHTRVSGESIGMLTDTTSFQRDGRKGGSGGGNLSEGSPGQTPIENLPINDLSKYGVPDLFRVHFHSPHGPIAESREEPSDHESENQPESWLFGQFNKLLPAKASCRALSNLIAGEKGVDLQEAGKTIAAAATDLGGHLSMLDRRFNRDRDDKHCIAFPSYGSADKGRLRYANQFVGSFNKEGVLSGMLVDLKLLHTITSRTKEVSLTQAGWTFALLKNPVLQNEIVENDDKFSVEEREFLINHIVSSVPRERSAFLSVLSAIADGNDTPDKVRASVIAKASGNHDETSQYVATQITGAISRMNDLNLLYRQRDGVRVKYVLTNDGKKYLTQVANAA